MSTLEAIPKAWAAGFLVGQGWVTSLSEVERWSGVDFTQLIGGRGGSLEENGVLLPVGGGMAARQADSPCSP